MGEIESQQTIEGEERSQLEGLGEAAGQAMEAMFKALAALLLVLVIMTARALQAAFILARFAVYPACAAAEVYGAVVLFRAVSTNYGGDFAAIVLALALVVLIPAAMLILKGDLPLWPVLLGSGALSFGAAWLIDHSPQVILAFVPVVALSACVLSFTFSNGGRDEQV